MRFESLLIGLEASACCIGVAVDRRRRTRPAAAPPAGRAGRRRAGLRRLSRISARKAGGPAPAGSNTSVTLKRMRPSPLGDGTRPVPPSATPKIAATPSLPKSASSASRFTPRLVCFSSLSSAAMVSSVRRPSSASSQLARLGVEPLFGFGRLPVGDDLVAHLVQRAVAGRRDRSRPRRRRSRWGRC